MKCTESTLGVRNRDLDSRRSPSARSARSGLGNGAAMKPTIVAFGSGNEQPAAPFRTVRSGLVRGALALAAVFSVPGISVADEGGVSFWLPGLYGSLSAVPQAAPGWSLLTFNYYTNVSAGANVSAAREVEIGRLPPTTATANLSASLHAQADLQWIQPNYTFATPVLGGQFTVSMAELLAERLVGALSRRAALRIGC